MVGLVLAGDFYLLRNGACVIPIMAWGVLRYLYARPAACPAPMAYVQTNPVFLKTDYWVLLVSIFIVVIVDQLKLYIPNFRLVLLWLAAVFVLGVGWWQHRSIPMAKEWPVPEVVSSTMERILYGVLIVLAAGMVYAVRYYDPDDQVYLKLASMTLDNPERALLSWNGQPWPGDFPLWPFVFRLHAYELLVALVASLFDVEPIVIAHQLFPPLFGALIVMAQGMLLRHLIPKEWLAGLILTVFFLVSVGGESFYAWAVYSFIQIHFGKAILFSVMVPLLFLLASRFMLTGHHRDWLLLSLAQIAALGFSSSALFVATSATGVSLAAHWQFNRVSTGRLLMGLGACWYLVACGLLIKLNINLHMEGVGDYPRALNFMKVFGSGPHLWLYLTALLGGWTLVTQPQLRRYLLGLALFFFLVILNPLLHDFLMHNLTGGISLWRLYLALPLPVIAAIAVVSLLTPWKERLGLNLAWVLFVLCGVVLALSMSGQWRGAWSSLLPVFFVSLLLLVWYRLGGGVRPAMLLVALPTLLAFLLHFDPSNTGRRTTLHEMGRTRYQWTPGYKMPEQEYKVAQHIVRIAPAGDSVLAALDLVPWVPTLRHAPGLVALEAVLLNVLQVYLEPQGPQERHSLLEYISGIRRPERPTLRLQEALSFYRIGLVAVSLTNPWLEEIASVLDTAGFRRQDYLGFRLWVKGDGVLR
ncbi:MAG: hypothetical protein G8237_07845 [Magnetococcales bacterium]|nr:hypothetical protein [Magnetococcales bacterium]NGZ06254.1 hypothetical protein [Magnetococcales bacterium]